MVSFDVSKQDGWKIKRITDAVKARLGSIDYGYQEIMMDLTACHANGCPLDLDAMIGASDFDLIHDVLGIRNHLNRRSGQLMNHFWPRLAVKS